MKNPLSVVATVVLALAALGCLGTGAVVFIFLRAFSAMGGDGAWDPASVSQHDMKALYGVKLLGTPPHYTARQFGFQDPCFEVLAELPPGGVTAFLGSNHLERGVPTAVNPDSLDQARELTKSKLDFNAFELALPEETDDGGYSTFYRSAELLETDGGTTWVHLLNCGM